MAINIDRLDIVKLLIDAGANLHDSTYCEDSPLGLAVTKGNLKIVKLLLQAGADPNFGGIDPPIINAIGQEDLDIFKTLMNWNADINACDVGGTTTLMVAAITGNIEIVEILLEEEANPDAIDTHGDIALYKAAYYGRQEVFDYLMLLTSTSILEGREYLQQKLATGIVRLQRLNTKG